MVLSHSCPGAWYVLNFNFVGGETSHQLIEVPPSRVSSLPTPTHLHNISFPMPGTMEVMGYIKICFYGVNRPLFLAGDHCYLGDIQIRMMKGCELPEFPPGFLVLVTKHIAKAIGNMDPNAVKPYAENNVYLPKCMCAASAWITSCRCGTVLILANVVNIIPLR